MTIKQMSWGQMQSTYPPRLDRIIHTTDDLALLLNNIGILPLKMTWAISRSVFTEVSV